MLRDEAAIQRRRRAERPEHYRAIVSRSRAKRLRAPGRHTAADVRRIYANQHGLCYWCRVPVGDRYHVDHVIPLSRGGSDDAGNLVVACPSCNLRKHAKMPSEFAGRLL